MKKETGEKVFTNWTVKELIGQGAFGKVYRIEREEFGTVYQAAMKKIVIPQSQEDIEDAVNEGMDEQSVTSYFRGFVEEIVNEFKLMAQLKGHTNVVSYEDHMVIPHEDGIGWDILIRMELLKSLKSATSEHSMTEQDVIRLGRDICNALELCDRMNIIHRDIKPENIFVTPLGEYKLGDFGIAKMAEKTMSNLSRKGTYTYMAPEVYKGEEYNATVDLYSLGIVMYRFMNYNRTPFLPAYPQPISFSDREASLTRRISEAQMRNELESLLRTMDKQGINAETVAQTAQAMMPDEDEETATAVQSAGQPQPVQSQPMEQSAMPADVFDEPEDETVSVFGGQTVHVPQNPVQPPVREHPAPEKPKKKKNGLLIVLGVIGIVLVLAAAAMLLIGRIGGSAAPAPSEASNETPHIKTAAEYFGEDDESEDAAQESAVAEKAEEAAPKEAEWEPKDNRYLYGYYEIDGFREGEASFEGMETVSVNKKALISEEADDSNEEEEATELAVIPIQLACFPEGSVYNATGNRILKDLLDETGGDTYCYASKTYLEKEAVYLDDGVVDGEYLFQAIARDCFGEEILPQVHTLYEEQIKGQRDMVDLLMMDEEGHPKSLIGYYRMDGSLMDLAYLDLDEEGRLTLRSFQYRITFSGDNMNIANGGVTRTMTPYRPEKGRIQLCGYANTPTDAYEGISQIFYSIKEGEAQSVSLYFTDGWRTEDAVAEIEPGNRIQISWKQQAKLGDSYQKRENAGSLLGTYVDCGDLGLILRVDGRDYFYQQAEMEYYVNLLGDSIIDAEMEAEELLELAMTQMELLKAIRTGYETTGHDMEGIHLDEKTGRITLDDGILFAVDSAELSEEGEVYLDALCLAFEAAFLGDNGEYLDEIIVEGHTDSSGDYQYNLELSEERAWAVAEYCSEAFPDLESYLYGVGCAGDMPVLDEDGKEDREASGRVVFWITLDADAFLNN